LCGQFEKAGVGARRLELSLFRVDGSIERTAIGTGRPSRDNVHLMKLFQEPLSHLDAGFGVELMMLSAAAVEPFDTQQVALAHGPRSPPTKARARRGCWHSPRRSRPRHSCPTIHRASSTGAAACIG